MRWIRSEVNGPASGSSKLAVLHLPSVLQQKKALLFLRRRSVCFAHATKQQTTLRLASLLRTAANELAALACSLVQLLKRRRWRSVRKKGQGSRAFFILLVPALRARCSPPLLLPPFFLLPPPYPVIGPGADFLSFIGYAGEGPADMRGGS